MTDLRAECLAMADKVDTTQAGEGNAVKRVALIDGDIIAYSVAAACERPVNWGDGVWSLQADEKEGREKVGAMLADLQDAVEASEICVCLSDPERNFRKDLLPTYKAGRENTRPPMIRRPLEAYLREAFDAKTKPTLEADDVLGILATNPKLYSGYEKVIVSLDKDLRSIPGRLYQWNHPERGVQEISVAEANRWHLIQTLAGDQTDGYAGCPGIGVTRAERLLRLADLSEDVSAWWPLVVEAYEKKGLTEEDALLQARVARILRHEDFNYKKQEPILWSPN